jgi:hypothetical protein
MPHRPTTPRLAAHTIRKAAFSHRAGNQEKGGGGSALAELGDAAAREDHRDLPR